jgi:hypothetical protein
VTPTVWRRAFAFTSAVLFVLSWIFPLGAGLAKDTSSFPKWWGTVDVWLALVLAISAFVIQGMVGREVDTQAEKTTYRFYRISTHAIMGVGVVVMLAGDRIIWAHCATGFLWRTWLLLYILPWWLAAVRRIEIRPSH